MKLACIGFSLLLDQAGAGRHKNLAYHTSGTHSVCSTSNAPWVDNCASLLKFITATKHILKQAMFY